MGEKKKDKKERGRAHNFHATLFEVDYEIWKDLHLFRNLHRNFNFLY